MLLITSKHCKIINTAFINDITISTLISYAHYLFYFTISTSITLTHYSMMVANTGGFPATNQNINKQQMIHPKTGIGGLIVNNTHKVFGTWNTDTIKSRGGKHRRIPDLNQNCNLWSSNYWQCIVHMIAA